MELTHSKKSRASLGLAFISFLLCIVGVVGLSLVENWATTGTAGRHACFLTGAMVSRGETRSLQVAFCQCSA
jgi:hypothetical protein